MAGFEFPQSLCHLRDALAGLSFRQRRDRRQDRGGKLFETDGLQRVRIGEDRAATVELLHLQIDVRPWHPLLQGNAEGGDDRLAWIDRNVADRRDDLVVILLIGVGRPFGRPGLARLRLDNRRDRRQSLDGRLHILLK